MKRIVMLVLVAGLGGFAAYWYWPRPAGPVMQLHGTVEVQEVRLGSKVGGRVASVSVKEGQTVSAGQELVRFDDAELVARRDQAKHKLASARAAWEKANRGPLPEEVTEAKAAAAVGRAKLARVLAWPRPELKAHAKSELDTEQVELLRAEAEYDRVFRQSSSSLLERDNATAARDRARGRVAAAKASYEMNVKGSIPEDIAEAEAERDRTEARHAFVARGTRDEDKAAAYAAVGEAEAKLTEAETALKEAVVVAPEKCVIETLSVRAGDLVAPNQPIVRALRADDLWVKVFVPSTELGKVKLGRDVEVSVDSHPGRRFPGKVSQIATVSEFTPRNVQSVDERRHQVFAVKVVVTDPDGVFKSGMAAEVYLDTTEGR
jgi:multidrug resistance efflux pump